MTPAAAPAPTPAAGPRRLPSSHRATRAWEPSRGLRGSIDDAVELVHELDSIAVLTGAGISTASGVPDYRGPSSQRATPMLYDEFVRDEANRRRYWARSFQGWAHMGRADPNDGHRALVDWERSDAPCRLTGVVTQNVDGLHEAAGQQRLVTLHGRIADVVCLGCGEVTGRARLQGRLAALNPDVPMLEDVGHAELRPDGDAVVDEWQDFVVAACERCGGVLKPDVVYFGEPVPMERVRASYDLVDAADALLVAGSSLTVMSGLRFARHAVKQGKPLMIVNHGATRADELATIRLDAPTSEVLRALTGR